MFYFIKTPWFVKKLFPGGVWNMPREQKQLFLTFDDGPHPQATPFILGALREYQAKASFFCIGKNVQQETTLYRQILEEGHRVGNHTFNHLNGWKTGDREYFEDIAKAAHYIDSNLFRPPYGRISRFQLAQLQKPPFQYKVIMWDVLSADFDQRKSGDECALNVIRNAKPGSIVVFHDSAKSFERMRVALPKVLQYFSEKGFRFEALR